jgi:hypothetical protein
LEATVSYGAVNDAVTRVEHELSAIWSTVTAEGDAPKVRASTMNFVVVTAPSELDRLRDSTHELGLTHAGRAFLVWADDQLAPWDVVTEVSAICRAADGSQVCADRVELGFGVNAADRIASIVAALTLSEVPIVLELAHGAPNRMADDLAVRADRIIVDSAIMPLDRIADLARRTRATIADRNFVRAFTFRDLIARFFDTDPGLARAIRRIEVARTPGFKIDPAGLLIGWLASRLGMRFESRASATDGAGQPVEIVLTDEARGGLGPGQIVAVRLSVDAGRGEEPKHFSMERTPSHARVLSWIKDGERHEHPLGFRDETWVLIKAIDDRGVDTVYREAVLAGSTWEAR